MSVVVKGVGESNFSVFCKGSPEKIKSISLPETLPANFDTALNRYFSLNVRLNLDNELVWYLGQDSVNYFEKIHYMGGSNTEHSNSQRLKVRFLNGIQFGYRMVDILSNGGPLKMNFQNSLSKLGCLA